MIAPAVIVESVLPSSILHSRPFLVLLTFVAINTIAYATLSITKLLPRVRWRRGLLRRSDPRDRRSETRGIYPNAPANQ